MTQADGLTQDVNVPNIDGGADLQQANATLEDASPNLDEASDLKLNALNDLTGWIRIDNDNVIRGWARNRGEPTVRQSVDIYINEALVGTVCADRFDLRLQQVGEGDGSSAFAMVVPDRFRTGDEFTLTAFISGASVQLRSKKPEFQIAPAERAPRIELTQVSAAQIFGRVVDGQYFKSVALEVWLDGARQDNMITTKEMRRRDEVILDFEIEFDLPAFARLFANGVIAAPGMIEAGLNTPLVSDTADLTATLGEDHRLRLQPVGLLDPSTVNVFQVQARPTDDFSAGPIVLTRAESEGDGVFVLPDHLGERPLEISFSVGGVMIERLSMRVQGPPRRLIANGSFQQWEDGGPTGWKSDASQPPQRGYYAFPTRIIEAQGITGDTVWIDLESGTNAEVVLLKQMLARPALLWSTSGLVVSAMVRASEPVSLTLRLRRVEATDAIAEWPLILHQPWSWQFLSHALEVAGSPSGDVVLELIAHDAGGASIEVAGLMVANTFGIAEEEQPDPPSAPPENLVRNHELTSWPHGVAVRASRGRFEAAEGWYVLNRRSAAPVLARATPREEDDGFAFSFCAEEIADYCRLEVSLGETLWEADTAHLNLEIVSDAAARRLFRSSRVRLPEFLLIDRIMLLKRSTIQSDAGFKVVDTTIGVFARKVLVTRTARTIELSVPTAEPANLGEFAWEVPERDQGEAEFLVVFEMRQPFAMTIRRMSVTTDAVAASPPAPTPYLQLEDYAIASQALLTKGLETWVGDVSIGPPAAGDEPARPAGRWTWGLAGSATVEVVICVYNAIEETLACLRSLAAYTTVPHLVHLIDDASEDYVTSIEQFIADKPWMRLSRNPRNLGYTASANLGLRGARSEWVVLLNSDTIVTSGWLEGLMECAASDPAIAFVGPVSNAATYQSVPDLYDAKNGWKINTLPEGWTPERMADLVRSASQRDFPDTPLLNGFCTLMKRAAFMEIGGLNEGAFPAGYGEENDLCTRAVKAGYKLAVADHVYVYHSKSASFGAARRTDLAKAGGKALAALHPDVNYGELGGRFRDLPALVALRHAVKRAVQQQHQGEG